MNSIYGFLSGFMSEDVFESIIFCLSIAMVLVIAYWQRKAIYKVFNGIWREATHKNFFDRYLKLKTVKDKISYPKYKWREIRKGNVVIKKKGYLEVRNLFENREKLMADLDKWSAEFKEKFVNVSMISPGTFIFNTSAVEHYRTVKDRDLDKASNGYISFGLEDGWATSQMPLFTGIDSPLTQIVSKSGHGKTYALSRIIAEAVNQDKNTEVLLLTSKGGPLVQSLVLANGTPNKPLKYIDTLRDLPAALYELEEIVREAEERLKTCEQNKEEFDLSKKVLIVLDECGDVFNFMKGKDASEDDRKKALICGLLEEVARKLRNVGLHLIISGQDSSVSSLPPMLKANVGNKIVGKIAPSFIDSVYPGIDNRMFEGLERATWIVETPTRVPTKVLCCQIGTTSSES